MRRSRGGCACRPVRPRTPPTSPTASPPRRTGSAPPAVSTSASFAEVAPALGEVFGAARADGIEHFGYAEQSAVTTYLGTSTGTRLRFTGTEGRLELTAKSHERTRSAWAGRAGADPGRPRPARCVDAELRRGLEWQGRRLDVAAGRHPALLTPSAVADLMIDLYWSSVGAIGRTRGAASGASAGGGTRIGELVVDPRVHLFSDPSLPGLEAHAVRDGRRVVALPAASSTTACPPAHVDWIARRCAEQPHHHAAHRSRDGPRRSAPASTTCGSTSRRPTATSTTSSRAPDDGLLVTCLWYNRVVDPQTLLLTGLTRDGVYVVEGGEVVGAATNFRFNDSPVAVLGRIEDAGVTDPDPRPRDGRLLQPRRDAAAAREGLQLQHGLPGELSRGRTARCRAKDPASSGRTSGWRATSCLSWAVRRSGAAPRAERGPGEERAGVTEARVRRHPDASVIRRWNCAARAAKRRRPRREERGTSDELGAADNTAEMRATSRLRLVEPQPQATRCARLRLCLLRLQARRCAPRVGAASASGAGSAPSQRRMARASGRRLPVGR